MQEEQKKQEEVDESLPISRKDEALNSLVNFDNLNAVKKSNDEEEKTEDKPIYIKPDENQTGFVP